MEAFLVSTMVVGLAEIGDKTQILSLMLAARFLRPLPIILGILFATIANHAAAGLAGWYFSALLSGPWLRWIIGLSFLSVAVWALFPDKYEGSDKAIGRAGAFMSTLVAFFLAEIGDKTQIATVGLAARFEQFYLVVMGTTLGMMLANIPAVLLGHNLADKLPVKAIRIVAALVFAVIGVLTLARVGEQKPTPPSVVAQSREDDRGGRRSRGCPGQAGQARPRGSERYRGEACIRFRFNPTTADLARWTVVPTRMSMTASLSN